MQSKRLFVSYSRKNADFAERLAKDLRDAGYDVWIDFRSIKGGDEWLQAIIKGIQDCEAMVVCLSPDAVESEWVRRELLMARGQDKRVIPIMLDDVLEALDDYAETSPLRYIQIINFIGRYEAALLELFDALPGVIKPIAPAAIEEIDPAEIPNPFKGLEAFQATDADIFFGREELTARLVGKLGAGRRFIAVVGASGSGKSSLVRAGLIPAIRRDVLQNGSETWPIVIFTPGARPAESMAGRLVPLLGGALLPAVIRELESDPRALHLLTEQILTDAPLAARLVLIVDQFEEVFTRASQTEAQHFLDLLHYCATLPDCRAIILCTMRADFFDRLSGYPTIAGLFEGDNLLIVTDITGDGLRRSIEGPAGVVGLVYEHGLPDRILDEVRQQPGSLPLLQYALKELYERRDGRQLTFAAYEQIGGVRQALAQHAEAIYQAFGEADRRMMQRVLLQLVEVSDTGEATRRQVDRTTLAFRDVAADDVGRVLDRLTAADSRLLVATRGIAPSDDVEPPVLIEISHEALLREWERYRDWIADNEERLRYGGELLKDAQDWSRSGQNPDYLLTGSRLDRAVRWLDNADATALQRQYIQASQTAAEKRAEQEAQRAELEADRKRRLGQARFGLVLAIALMIGIAFIFVLINNATLEDTANRLEEAANRDATRVAELNTAVAQSDAAVRQIAGLVSGSGIRVEANSDWVPVTLEFDGVLMAYVPPGCFMMGSDARYSDELPVHEVCFEEPFWIDVYEVTNAQYGLVGCARYSSQPDQPRNCVDWYDAQTFCEARGASLPSEAQWEYAARGPSGWGYPWGNSIVPDNAVYGDTSDDVTAPVGSRPGGVSWVGAYDMAGNVREWTTTIYDQDQFPYPYSFSDGRDTVDRTDVRRVLRGGSFLDSMLNLQGAMRLDFDPDNGLVSYGFRCARSY